MERKIVVVKHHSMAAVRIAILRLRDQTLRDAAFEKFQDKCAIWIQILVRVGILFPSGFMIPNMVVVIGIGMVDVRNKITNKSYKEKNYNYCNIYQVSF